MSSIVNGLERATAAAILAGASMIAGARGAAAQTWPGDFQGQRLFLTSPDIPVRPRVNETIPLVVICMDFPGRTQHSLTTDQVYQAVFGPAPSTADYYTQQSGGLFQFVPAGQGVYGWYQAPQPEAWYANIDATLGGNSNTSQLRRTHSLQAVAQDFDFSVYDANGDGVITPEELAVICVWGDGTINSASSRNSEPASVQIGNVMVNLLIPASWEGRAGPATFAHELGHAVFGLVDLYDTGAPLTENITSFSLMADDWALNLFMGIPPLDPWARLHLGWLNATVVTGGDAKGGWFQLRDAETTSDALVFPVYGRGTSEYFIAENRSPGVAATYDSGFNQGAQGLWQPGLAIWHIDEDLPQMNQVIRLCRATGPLPVGAASGNQPDDRSSLFDGASAARGYDWNDRSAPRNSKTRGGGETGIGIWHMPAASPVVSLWAGDPYDALSALDQAISAEAQALQNQIPPLRAQIDEIQEVEEPAERDRYNRGEESREAFLWAMRGFDAQIAALRKQMDDLNARVQATWASRGGRMAAIMDSVAPPSIIYQPIGGWN